MADTTHESTLETYFELIPLGDLQPNEYNARRFAENMTPQRMARFNELVASIREKGIIEPLLVRPLGSTLGEGLCLYEVIAGERRYRAAREVVGSSDIPSDYLVPCMVRNVGDDDAFDLMIIENMQRDDLTPLEAAQAFAAYLSRHGNAPDAAAELSMRTGIPVHAIRRQVRLLEVPAEVLAAWKDGVISQAHVELFTRISDRAQALELLDACRRSKLSSRELAERIGAASPDLDKGFFDKAECQTCHFNTSVQSGLFSDAGPGGKCGNPACFEQKQGAFLAENWPKSKAAEMFLTNGFRFGHRIGQERCEPLIAKEIAERCTSCDRFVTVLRLTGAVVSGYAQCCTGPLICCDELYRKPEPAPAAPVEKDAPPPPPKEQPGGGSVPIKGVGKLNLDPRKTKPASLKPGKKQKPQKETGPVNDPARAHKFRELFFKSAIKEKAAVEFARYESDEKLPLATVSIALVALLQSSPVARSNFGVYAKSDDSTQTIFADMKPEEVRKALEEAAIAHLVDVSVSAGCRVQVAEYLGIDLAMDFVITREYLEAMSKEEIIRVGEEPGVALWKDPQVEAFRKERHKGKALHSLTKDVLISTIMNSGVDLAGKVPAEILGKGK